MIEVQNLVRTFGEFTAATLALGSRKSCVQIGRVAISGESMNANHPESDSLYNCP